MLIWYLEASKRENDKVTSLQETKKLLETVPELKKRPLALTHSPSAPPACPLLSELPGPDTVSFSLASLPPPAVPSPLVKEDKKSEVMIAPFKEKLTTGGGELSSVLMYTPWAQAEVRALAKEFPSPSQDLLGFAKEFELTHREPTSLGFQIYIDF